MFLWRCIGKGPSTHNHMKLMGRTNITFSYQDGGCKIWSRGLQVWDPCCRSYNVAMLRLPLCHFHRWAPQFQRHSLIQTATGVNLKQPRAGKKVISACSTANDMMKCSTSLSHRLFSALPKQMTFGNLLQRVNTSRLAVTEKSASMLEGENSHTMAETHPIWRRSQDMNEWMQFMAGFNVS